jgi:hypothetical protein
MTEKIYIGTKIIAAEPMTRWEFEMFKNPNIIAFAPEAPRDEPGYRVRYEDGYVSWSPKEVFERCYREMTISEQAIALFAGVKWSNIPVPLRVNVIEEEPKP